MKLKFEKTGLKIIDERNKDDIILNGGNISVCYTKNTDDITKGDKPASTPYQDRTEEFTNQDNILVSKETNATLTVKEEFDGLIFELTGRDSELSEFGINLPFNFMGKNNGGGWFNQFLFNSPYVSKDRETIYAYLTKPNGNNLVVAVKKGAGWKMDYSPYLGGHYFLNLKLFSNFDKAYKMPKKENKLIFGIFPVKNFDDCLNKLAIFLNKPFMNYDKSGGVLGEKILLKFYGKCDGIIEKYKDKIEEKQINEEYVLTKNGEVELLPTYQGKIGAGITIYAYKNIIELYKKSMDTVDLSVVAKTDGNLCEHQCWASATLRFLLKYKKYLAENEIKTYEEKVKSLLNVVTETDESKAVARRTILATASGKFPAYNIYKSTRIQEEFFGITLLLDAFLYYNDKKYYNYAINTMDSLLDNYQKSDGRLETFSDNRRDDYTTVCCPMIPIVDMSNFIKGKDDAHYKKYFSAATKMAEYLYNRGLNFPTEGGYAKEAETEMEDGSISCTALSLLYYSKNLCYTQKYVEKSKEILKLHENWVIKTPICQMNNSSLRWWETQWEGDADGPAICAGHAWTIWRAEADYLYYELTNEESYKVKATNGFLTNLSKIQESGKSYAIYNIDDINGGGFHKKAEEVSFKIASKFAETEDCDLSRYVWIRLSETFLKSIKIE